MEVLVIDDQALEREAIMEYIKQGIPDASVHCFYSLRNFIESGLENIIDVAVCDHYLSSETSLDVHAYLVERGIDIPFIIVSQKEMSLGVGNHAFVCKKDLAKLPDLILHLHRINYLRNLTKL